MLFRRPSRRLVGALALASAALGGCSSTDDSDAMSFSARPPAPLDEPDSYGGVRGESSGDDGELGDDDDSVPEGGTDGGDLGDESGESGSSESGGIPPKAESAGFEACPEPLPEGWLFCEDFEQLENFDDVFFEYQPGDGAFQLDETRGASGSHSMRASYMEGVEGAGWLSVAVGENPAAEYEGLVQVAPDDHFTELYVRFRLRMSEGWPDLGPGKLSRVMTIANEDFGHAIVAKLSSDGDGTTLLGEASRCVAHTLEEPCRGFDDASQAPIGQLPGAHALFSAESAGTWHCVETHVKLNRPIEPGDEADGLFEFWVDDELDARRERIDWRGSWNVYGLNLVTIENFWPGGAPEPLDRWVDDLVISTEPIGCQK